MSSSKIFLPKTLQVSNRRLSINLLIKKLLGMNMEGKRGELLDWEASVMKKNFIDYSAQWRAENYEVTRWHEFEDRALESMVLSCSVSIEGLSNSYKLSRLNKSKSFCHFQTFVAIISRSGL